MTEAHTIAELLSSFDAEEIWRPIRGWPYEVSSWGRVRRFGSLHALAAAVTSGYAHVDLSCDGEQHQFRIHRLVADEFLGPPPFEGAIVAHNDGNSLHNRASNLRWASALENQADRQRHSTRIFGSAVFGAKLTEGDIPAIRTRIRDGESYPSIADDYGVSVSTISLIKLGRIWRQAQAVNGGALP